MKNILTFLLVAVLGIAAFGQGDFYNPLPATGATAMTIKSDTVTNAGTSYLTTKAIRSVARNYTAISVNVTKISGTVGGTITLQGSTDGTNFKAISTTDTQTSVTTITAADASAVYNWRILGSPFPYYRVSWTGTGTMAASFSAQFYRSK
jgi:hypothetical protein